MTIDSMISFFRIRRSAELFFPLPAFVLVEKGFNKSYKRKDVISRGVNKMS